MDDAFIPDELVEDGETFFYRQGRWTNPAGMCVSLTKSQQMTMKFYALHGRSPHIEPKKKPKRRTKKVKEKEDRVRAALKKAQAKKSD